MIPKFGDNPVKVLSRGISQYTSKTHTSSETRAHWRDVKVIFIFTKGSNRVKELRH